MSLFPVLHKHTHTPTEKTKNRIGLLAAFLARDVNRENLINDEGKAGDSRHHTHTAVTTNPPTQRPSTMRVLKWIMAFSLLPKGTAVGLYCTYNSNCTRYIQSTHNCNRLIEMYKHRKGTGSMKKTTHRLVESIWWGCNGNVSVQPLPVDIPVCRERG